MTEPGRIRRPILPAPAVVVIVLAATACSSSPAPTPSTTSTATVTTPPPIAPAPALRGSSEDGWVVDWEALSVEPFFGLNTIEETDPFWHLNTDAAADGFLLALELYTVYGPDWTGETGTFSAWCEATGICIHFDPDGDGPLPDLGADFQVTGEVIVHRLDEDGYDLELVDIEFSDGSTLAGPLRLKGD